MAAIRPDETAMSEATCCPLTGSMTMPPRMRRSYAMALSFYVVDAARFAARCYLTEKGFGLRQDDILILLCVATAAARGPQQAIRAALCLLALQPAHLEQPRKAAECPWHSRPLQSNDSVELAVPP